MILSKRCWYPAFVIYRWRHVLLLLPLVALLGLLALHWDRLRCDHALASFSTRFATQVFSGSEPSKVSQLFDLVHSPEILGKAARDLGLGGLQGMADEKAAEALCSRVICETDPSTGSFELKVRKLRDGDAVLLCKAIEFHLRERLNKDLNEQVTKGKAERTAVLKKAAEDLEAKLEKSRAEFLAQTPTIENPVDETSRFESLVEIQADRRLLGQLELQIQTESIPVCFESPLQSHQAPHWAGRPASRHLQHFGISAAWTFGISVLLAITFAYLLEALVPRKENKEEFAPETAPEHGYS